MEGVEPGSRPFPSPCRCFQPGFTFTSSKGNLSWKMRLILAPPDSSSVSTWSPEPSIRFSKSTPNCWTILWERGASSVRMLGWGQRRKVWVALPMEPDELLPKPFHDAMGSSPVSTPEGLRSISPLP